LVSSLCCVPKSTHIEGATICFFNIEVYKDFWINLVIPFFSKLHLPIGKYIHKNNIGLSILGDRLLG
ncbi:hypothetical protein ACJX0J_018209, partial [Zea mays]